MSTQIYPTQIYGLSCDAPYGYLFFIQASTGRTGLTLAQLETARNAATSVLELVGATVESASSVMEFAPRGTGTTGRLLLSPVVEIDGDEEDAPGRNASA